MVCCHGGDRGFQDPRAGCCLREMHTLSQTCFSMKEWDRTAPRTHLSCWGNEKAFWKVPTGMASFIVSDSNTASWCDEKRLFVTLPLLISTLCLSLLMHSLPTVLVVWGEGVIIITIISENLYFFHDLSLIIIAFYLKCNIFTSLYVHVQLHLLLVWFGKDSKMQSLEIVCICRQMRIISSLLRGVLLAEIRAQAKADGHLISFYCQGIVAHRYIISHKSEQNPNTAVWIKLKGRVWPWITLDTQTFLLQL